MNIYTFTKDYKKKRMSMGGKTLLDILNCKEELCFKLYLNKAKMPGLIIWGKNRFLTEYGKRKIREILEAEVIYDLEEIDLKVCWAVAPGIRANMLPLGHHDS